MKNLDITLMLAVTLTGVAYAASSQACPSWVKAGMFLLGFVTIAMSIGQKSKP